MFKREWFSRILPVAPRMTSLVRYWDKAGTAGGTGARTAGVLMATTDDIAVATGGARVRHHYVVVDVVAGRWDAADREQAILQTAQSDRRLYGSVETWVEQEPGSGGKESAQNTVVMLGGFLVKIERVTGSKAVRAEPFASQCAVGNVSLLDADWTDGFIGEAEKFPKGELKDQIDAAGGAFNKIAAGLVGVIRDPSDIMIGTNRVTARHFVPRRLQAA
jgi:predicted phage terminase large subunit-like protein